MFIENKGSAESHLPVFYNLAVTSISPGSGSMIGGTEIRVTGDGFTSFNKTDYEVFLTTFEGKYPCVVESADPNTGVIECTTSGTGKKIVVDNNGFSESKKLFFHLDHVHTLWFRSVPKRNEAVLLVIIDVTATINQ